MRFTLKIIFILWMIKYVHNLDPCMPSGHSKFPSQSIGLRNENCTIPGSHDQVCDKYLDTAKWYVIEGGKLLNHCPNKGTCGNAYPAWMNGSFPKEEDGVVNMTACIKRNNVCCKDHLTMKVKNCSSFYVYRLKPLKECTSAYCIESDLPCRPPTTTTQTTITTTTSSGKGTATKTIIAPTEDGLSDLEIALIVIGVIIVIVALAGLATAFICKNKSFKCKCQVEDIRETERNDGCKELNPNEYKPSIFVSTKGN